MKLYVGILSLIAMKTFALEPNDQNAVIISKDERTRIMLNFGKLMANFPNENVQTQSELLAAAKKLLQDII